jgi:hypothetical protein
VDIETKEQYERRLAKQKESAPHVTDKTARLVESAINHVKGYKMFNVLTAEDAAVVEASARTKGMYKDFLRNITDFHKTWSKTNEGSFVVPLNVSEGDVFYGKGTDTLYTGINTQINNMELRENWRLIKHNGGLMIAAK